MSKPNQIDIPSVSSVPRRRFTDLFRGPSGRPGADEDRLGERGSLGFLRILASWLVIVQLLAYVVIRANLSGSSNALYRLEVCERSGFDLAFPARVLACEWKGTAPVVINGSN